MYSVDVDWLLLQHIFTKILSCFNNKLEAMVPTINSTFARNEHSFATTNVVELHNNNLIDVILRKRWYLFQQIVTVRNWNHGNNFKTFTADDLDNVDEVRLALAYAALQTTKPAPSAHQQQMVLNLRRKQ